MSEQHHPQIDIPGGHLPGHHGALYKRARSAGMLVGVLLLIGLGLTVATRILHSQNLNKSTADNARQYVAVMHADGAGTGDSITLPATLQGMIEAPIYARASGYVLRWGKDIGAKVTKGEVLAEIDAPEVDAQLNQAQATRAQQASALELARSSAERWEALRKKDAVTQQELNERESAFVQARANLAAAEADVQRLQKLEGFKSVRAPFDGVIVRRDVDVGDLVDAGNGGAGKTLFMVSKVDPLRLYVYVPQSYARSIKVGDVADVALTDNPGAPVQGKVAHIAGAIDATTRTLQVEIHLPNHDGKLLAGSYAQVGLKVSASSNALKVPSNVLLFRPEGIMIAVVDGGGHVHLHKVTVGRDLGNTLEVLSGITVADQLVVNPPDSLAENDVVTIAKPAAGQKENS